MAATGRRAAASVAAELLAEPHCFEFFQAVRLLDQMKDRPAVLPGAAPLPQLGCDAAPGAEAVRFRASLSSSFPASAIQSLAAPPAAESGAAPPRMDVNFLGLTGPTGVLPHHFTTLLIERRRANDLRAEGFQDLFNHRLVALFYRAWEKYRFPVSYERARRLGQRVADDVLSRCVLSLTGHGVDGLLNRQAFDDEALIYYAGLLAHQPRNAAGLRGLLQDYFRAPVQIQQHTGQWVMLEEADRSRLPSRARPRGQHAGLGRGLTVGERVFLLESRFRVVVGPLTFEAYARLLPNGDGFAALQDWIRSYSGMEFDFDVQLILHGPEVPPTRCGLGGSRLGWTSFMCSTAVVHDVHGARLACRDRV